MMGRTDHRQRVVVFRRGMEKFGSPGFDSPVPFLTFPCVKLLMIDAHVDSRMETTPPSHNIDP